MNTIEQKKKEATKAINSFVKSEECKKQIQEFFTTKGLLGGKEAHVYVSATFDGRTMISFSDTKKPRKSLIHLGVVRRYLGFLTRKEVLK